MDKNNLQAVKYPYGCDFSLIIDDVNTTICDGLEIGLFLAQLSGGESPRKLGTYVPREPNWPGCLDNE
jgi:hypothetical protein